MKCKNCGKEVPESAKICGHCGEDPHAKVKTKRPSTQPPGAPELSKTAPEKSPSPKAESKIRPPLIWIGLILILAIAAVVIFILPNMGAGDEADVNISIEQTIAALSANQVAAAPSDTPLPALPESAPPSTEAADAPTESAPPTPTEEIIEEGPLQIAFASDRSGRAQIWIINQDGSGEEQLTDLPSGACQPTWSPDGLSLAFTSPCERNRDYYPGSAIFRYELASGELSQISSGGDGDFDPAWSPMGDQIVFTSIRLGRSQLYLLDLASGTESAISGISLYEYQAAWAPSASDLAFVSTADGPELIYSGAAAVGKRSQELSVAESEEKFVSSPAWAANGQGIYYTRSPRSGGFAELYYLPIAGNPTPHQAVFSPVIPGRDVSPSPDGNWLAFESWPNTSNHDIWTSTSSGDNPTRLTSNDANEFDAAWRP